MAALLPGLSGNSPISVDLMYQYYDNKAITPQIRGALQKRDEAEAKDFVESLKDSKESPKFGPSARVDITQQIIRANIVDKTPTLKKEEPVSESKYKRYDVLTEVRKQVSEREAKEKAAADKEKAEILQGIQDKIAAEEAAKKAAEEEKKAAEE
jgi:hypothetical protein